MNNLTPRDRMFLFYGGIIAAVIVVYSLILEPGWNSFNEMKEEIPRVAALKGRFLAIMEGTAEQGKKRDFLNKEFRHLLDASFEGSTEALATGQLADTVRTKAVSVGLTLKSSKAERAETMGVFQKISLKITLDASLKQLAMFMEKIQNSPKRILIQEAKLTTHKDRYANDRPETLSVKLLITGLRYVK